MPIGDIAEAAGQGGNTSWQPIALEGSWKGHWMGAFSISKAQLQQMADGIKGSEIDIVVDFEHSTMFSDKAPAAGWIKEAQVRGNELVAQIVWTDTAAKHIREKEYKYLSPVIHWNTRDRQTGADAGTTIQSVALTNVPFLHELPEVRLNKYRVAFVVSQPEPEEPMDQKQFEALCKVLGMDPKTSTPEQVLTAMGERIALQGDVATQLAALNTALGIEAGADPVAAANALRAQATASDPAELAALRTQMTAFQETQDNAAALTAVQLAQGQGKVAGVDSDNYKHAQEWAKKDLAGFTAYLATIPAFSVAPGHVAAISGSVPASPGLLESPEVDAAVENVCAQFGMTAKDIKEAKEADAAALQSGNRITGLWGDTITAPMQGKEKE